MLIPAIGSGTGRDFDAAFTIKNRQSEIKNPPSSFSRADALAARPVATEILRRVKLENGGQRITTVHRTTGYRRWLLRMPERVERTIELDALGVDVLDRCNGHTPVGDIVAAMAQGHGIDPPEAEQAVTAFLRMLIQRGIVAMVVTSPPEPRSPE